MAPRRRYYNSYHSPLEEEIATELRELGVEFEFEPRSKKIFFTQPAKKRSYLPDFILGNGIIIETKGEFLTADRQKHLMIQEQHPELDIRFVFSNPNTRINKGSKTTYAKWCDKYGFKWSKQHIPLAWIKEQKGG